MADEHAITLDELQRDILIPQIQAFLEVAPDNTAREAYEAIQAAVSTLSVPAELAGYLSNLVEVLLTSSRVRAGYGPGAELALWSLFQKTPRGRELTGSVESVNRALQRFKGQTLEFAGAMARGPGAYSLTLKTSGMQIVIRFGPGGIRVESAEIGSD
jgi:hypothetical protein